MKTGKLCSILVCAALLVGTAGCFQTPASSGATSPAEPASVASEAQPEQSTSKGMIIKVIPLSTASDYWLALKQGAEDAAAEFGAEYGGITIQYDGPKQDGDAATQIDILNNAVTAKADGVLLAATNPTALLSPVEDAIKAGVNVVTVDSGIEPNNADAFLATDNYEACKSLADYMAKMVGSSGKYAIIADNFSFTSGRDRPVGFDDGMAEHADMQSVGMQLCYGDIAKAEAITLNYLKANPDLSIVFAGNDRASVGATNAFIQEGIVGSIKLCGVDVSLDAIKNMRAGIVQACVLQKPYNMGYEGVKTLIALKKGEAVEKQTDTGVFLLTPENLDTDEGIAAIRQYIPDYDPEQTK